MTTQTDNAVTTAVQNTDKDDEKTLGELMKNPDKADLRVAYQAIDQAYDIQFGKDGIEDTQNKLTGLQGKVGEMVYAIAKTARAHCKDHNLAFTRSYFMALCIQAETHKQNWYIAKYKEQKAIGVLIPLWAQYKSRIAKGMQLGFDPAEALSEDTPETPKYATAAQFTAATQAKEKEERGSTPRAGEDKKPTDKQQQKVFQAVYSDLAQEVQAALGMLLPALRRLVPAKQALFAQDILNIAGRASAMADELAKTPEQRSPMVAQAVTEDGSTPTVTEQEVDPGTVAALQEAMARDQAIRKPPLPEDPMTETPKAEEPKKGSKRRGAKAA